MDIHTRTNLDQIIEFYAQNGLKEKPEDISMAHWKPTPISILLKGIIWLDIIYSIEHRKHKGEALIAGSGDGRWATCLANLGYNVTCTEINPSLVSSSKSLNSRMYEQGIIDTKKVRILEGNFMDDDLYSANSIDFKNFQMIFAYLTKGNLRNLIEKVEKESPNGTELFTLGFVDWQYPNTSALQRLDTKVLRDGSLTFHHELTRYRKNIH